MAYNVPFSYKLLIPFLPESKNELKLESVKGFLSLDKGMLMNSDHKALAGAE